MVKKKYEFAYGGPAERTLRVLEAIIYGRVISRRKLLERFKKVSEDRIKADLDLLIVRGFIERLLKGQITDPKELEIIEHDPTQGERIFYRPRWAKLRGELTKGTFKE